jgi:tRNA-splicing endonuclease subunit Sen15
MAPSATTANQLPPISAIEKELNTSKLVLQSSIHARYLQNLAATILHDLQHQHEWSSLTIHTHSTITSLPLPRPIISGLPPRRAYIHPDEQVEILKAEHKTGTSIKQEPEREWVLPTQIQEKWSLKRFSEVFDALDTVPPAEDGEDEDDLDEEVGKGWRGKNRQKRLLLATVHDDSTVVYYIMHDGIVKPRQN